MPTPNTQGPIMTQDKKEVGAFIKHSIECASKLGGACNCWHKVHALERKLESVRVERDAWKQEHGVLHQMYRAAESQLAEARRDVGVLREALIEARDDLEAWGAYASDYFQQKHDLEGNISRINKVLQSTAESAGKKDKP